MAGYLEGRVSAEDIFNFYENMRQNNPHKVQFEQMRDFFNKVLFNLQKKIKNIQSVKSDQTIIWSKLLLGYSQLEGLLHAYTYEMKKNNKYSGSAVLNLADLLILQADGEVPELLRYLRSFGVKSKMGDTDYFKEAFGIDTKDPKEFWTKLMMESKCSAFIKIVKNKEGKWEDLLVGHTTWAYYMEMLRSYKQ